MTWKGRKWNEKERNETKYERKKKRITNTICKYIKKRILQYNICVIDTSYLQNKYITVQGYFKYVQGCAENVWHLKMWLTYHDLAILIDINHNTTPKPSRNIK